MTVPQFKTAVKNHAIGSKSLFQNMCKKKCVICEKLLDESNISIEHIIPNAICGHLDSNKIYCKNCNKLQ